MTFKLVVSISGRQNMSKTMNAILKVLEKHQNEIIGSRQIMRELTLHGVELTERTIRYHLKIMDERGLTKVFGKEGRMIKSRGLRELSHAHVSDRVGFIISKMENLSYQIDFDLETCEGRVVLNVSLLPEEDAADAFKMMKKVFRSDYVMSDRVLVADSGQAMGDMEVPEGKVAVGTMCSVTINGLLLKVGIPVTSRFGGLMQVGREGPERFTALISYEGSSLDPHLIFIKSRMTNVLDLSQHKEGNVLASFREIPVLSVERAQQVQNRLRELGLGGILLIGNPNQPLLELPVGLDRAGMVVIGGLNPVAACEESGIRTETAAMRVMADFKELKPFKEAIKAFK
jgi:repressor of nif and glnA expression